MPVLRPDRAPPCRELYSLIAKDACQAKRDMFSDWFRERQKKFELTEGVDVYTLRSAYPNPGGGSRKVIEFIVTLQVAKQLAKRGMPLPGGFALLPVGYDDLFDWASKLQAARL